jgi:TetR/AcrR family transcriptional repressor of lmrAB and yxaGH operons
MPRTSDSRQRMVRSAAQLVRRQGYAATGWRQVVTASTAPWGSQAHHFPGGKEQLVAEAVTLSGARFERLLQAAMADAHPAEAVQLWADVAASELAVSDWADGCPVATVALETAHTSEVMSTACAAAFQSWQDVLRRAMTNRGLTEADAASLSMLTLSAIEGALLLSRANRSAEPLRVVGRELQALLLARIPGP